MQDEPSLTYGNLLNSIRSTIREAKEKAFGPNDEEFSMNSRLQYAHVLYQLICLVHSFCSPIYIDKTL